MESVLTASEIEFFIETMKPTEMTSIGSKCWLEWHNRLQKLNQEALLEASCLKDEHVKEYMITSGKAHILVHEAISINLWKRKVLKRMLDEFLPDDPENTFVAYTVLYHEAVAVALLELIMYHSDATESLNDSIGDLLEYAYEAACQLLVIKHQEVGGGGENAKEELLRQENNLTFDIGVRSLSILRYMADNLTNVTLNVSEKMYNVYDVSVLLVELLRKRPWIESGKKQYKAGQWIDWDGESLVQAEAQVWLTLRQLLLDPELHARYPITNSRRMQLAKLLPLLQPVLLDQLAPLIELKQWLCRATMSDGDQTHVQNKPILMETLHTIKESILKKYDRKWRRMARNQLPIVFNSDKAELKEIASSLSDAFNLDLLEKMEIKCGNECSQCGKPAIQRCSQCKSKWYCSRSCQVVHWPQHKEECIELAGKLKS